MDWYSPFSILNIKCHSYILPIGYTKGYRLVLNVVVDPDICSRTCPQWAVNPERLCNEYLNIPLVTCRGLSRFIFHILDICNRTSPQWVADQNTNDYTTIIYNLDINTSEFPITYKSFMTSWFLGDYPHSEFEMMTIWRFSDYLQIVIISNNDIVYNPNTIS